MGCKCRKLKKKFFNKNKLDLVQITSEDDDGNIYYLIIDKISLMVVDSCETIFPDIPLVQSIRLAR